MTLLERAQAYRNTISPSSASNLRPVTEGKHTVLYGTWLLGNDYRNKSKYYGAYPPGYLARAMAMFPDAERVLHAFSGALPPGAYDRCDLVQPAEYMCSVYDLFLNVGALAMADGYDLVLADPPYSPEDAKKYGTPGVDRRRALAALALVTRPGGHLVWLDTCWPMHSKTQWQTVGRITIIRSTNHRVRLCSIFERVAA